MIDTPDLLLATLTHALVARFAPERILLFGSRARGDHHPDSDFDLMLVFDGDSPPSEDVVRRVAVDLRASADIIVDTRERFERRRTDVGTLEYAAEQEGRLLYPVGAAPEPRHVRETPNGPPESLEEWVERARSDFMAMTELARGDASAMRDTVVFHAHQGVEKMLKAALVARRTPPPRTHDLTELLATTPGDLRDDPSLAAACHGLQALWPRSRYPGQPMPTGQQVADAVAWARTARELLSAAIATPG